MKLLYCHVENFGNLSNFDLSFQGGLNAFYHENGWGKTTLSVFLKVMFYGFGNEKRKNQSMREREKYKPWQGGIYGGTILFEVEGISYRMERIFGEREKEDQFMLYEENTGLVSNRFSKEIGKELFGLDEESFGKTIYVYQAHCSTEATDSIHARLGNLTEEMYDVEHYTKANQLLQQERNRLTEKRKTGRLAKLEEELGICEEEIQRNQDAQKQKEILQGEWERLQEEKISLEQQQVQIKEDILSVGQIQQQQALLTVYEELCAQVREKEMQVEELEEYFGNGIPDIEDITETIVWIEEERYLQGALDQEGINQEEKEWLSYIDANWDGIPSREQLEEIRMLSENSERTVKEQPEELQQSFSVNRFREIWEKNRQGNTVLLLGVCLAVIGCICCIWWPLYGVVFFCMGIFLGLLGKKSREKQLEEERIEEEKETKSVEEQQVETFLEKYPVENCKSLDDHINKLQVMTVQLDSIRKRYESQKEKAVKIQELEEKIGAFYEKYGLLRGENCMLQLQSILGILEKYHSVAADFYNVVEKKEQFEQEQDIAYLVSNTSSVASMEELHEQLSTNNDLLKQTNERLYELQKKLDCCKELEEEEHILQCRKEELQEQWKGCKRKYELLGKTQEYLQEAREHFVARYGNPLREGFQKYCNMLFKSEEQVFVDSHMEIKKKEKGMYRESDRLSAGWRDLLSVCLRLSVVDAMYQKEKPFLILDDPFINLDDKKMPDALKMLEKVAEEYQIIYFTCHESRSY